MSEKKESYQLEHVTKVFREGNNEVRAVDDVSFSIYEGEIFGIIGMSGAGKSTLVRTLNRLEEITDGTIRFDDVNLQELSAAQLRKERQSIAMIFQNFNLMMQKTVLDNVMAPMRIAKKLSRQQQRRRQRPIRRNCPGDSVNGLPLPERWRWILECCCVMKPPAHWTPK